MKGNTHSDYGGTNNSVNAARESMGSEGAEADDDEG